MYAKHQPVKVGAFFIGILWMNLIYNQVTFQSYPMPKTLRHSDGVNAMKS